MHLLSTRPGGFVEDSAVVLRIEQTPGDIVILSAADTTLSLLAAAVPRLGAGYPSVRLANQMYLRQPASLDLYIDEVLQHARVVVVDHLGGASDWAYGLERLPELARARGQLLVMFSGDLDEDDNLARLGNAPPALSHQLWRYLREGGAGNAEQFFRCLGQHAYGHTLPVLPAQVLPQAALYHRDHGVATVQDWQREWAARGLAGAPVVALLFYRSHLQAGNTDVFDAMAEALLDAGLCPLPLAVSSLKEPICREVLQRLCDTHAVSLVLNTTAFSVASLDNAGDADPPLANDAPVLQVILSGGNREDWLADSQGLGTRDVAMHVAMPEVDGRIITRAVSFKGLAYRCPHTEVDVVRYRPDAERIAFVAELARRWCRLRTLPAAEKRLALILANYPASEGRIGNGVGLDTPASVVRILAALRDAGYAVGPLPADGDALMQGLTRGVTNDLAQHAWRPAFQSVAMADYLGWLAQLPRANQDAIAARWGAPDADPMVRDGRFMIAGVRTGNVFVGIQPARAYGVDDYASYHDAELVPPHGYLAFYFWLRHTFGIDAVVHVGKHGNLEWLPGKSVALSEACWPDAILGPLPHLYPFIVNDPGEGAQAKRRAQAVIIDHLMPPLTRAENYGPLQDLERQVDEYYEALTVDPRRAKLLRREILKSIVGQQLHRELGIDAPASGAEEDALLNRTDAWLCELKESQIRDGLHVFGRSPQGRQRRDTLAALGRFPVGDGQDGRASLLKALAADLSLGDGFDPLDADWSAPWTGPRPEVLAAIDDAPWRHHGDTRERLEALALRLLDDDEALGPQSGAVLARLREQVAPRLDACGPQELLQLERGLAGRFVPAGPSGAPSRGRPDVLPTGRNFYSVDTRAVPTRTAWTLGLRAADQLIERHLQEHGEYPRAVGLSVWGTATMRTGGDDIAQAMALLGVRPKWAHGSHRVVDFEILPMAIFDRPRVDVTLRVSGFFRDAFANLVAIFDAAVRAVAALDEPEDVNPIRARVLAEQRALAQQGVDADTALERASWRVFGARPGDYGTGLQTLIDGRRWQTDGDLAHAYLHAGGYAYGQRADGVEARDTFAARLAEIDVVLQNQDNREHDILDANDYYQFQGGMVAAVRHLGGSQPAIYHGDHANPAAPRVRTLGEEIARVIRTRVVNPKWIDGVKRHGYKGAFEMAATVDYLFGYDATARVVGDHQYALVADAYVHDDATRDFLARHNPRALQGICERLLEAMERGLWQEPGDQRERIAHHLLDNEQRLEGMQ
ncbi:MULTISPECIES: cobaltochelatase subunit CobN [unclassified Cupriavidus]|uniref:cobaltochelatase subunit CobN n=1 Tax=unclassified Cupriavidus TaxID=2640874 RepID=UPI001C006FEF|nr:MULTISPECIES: cobaltochelatase subunit CobN [unclassified Cupriavidus]MCA3188968.1 cobaltochelatase subunit CobN [Cupriavidus sp.]MCA3198687.1 cobaltochelatase subunit CobN [Cupriavidus sp.]MCA3201433.1 cobaltochelatase subunit CobN [Cupriavidus sp.]MCA3208667.1 cobaltochelatase subunit CobN [Cupriavidus sp.]QWE97286.1 cobaltochelatase subunit CobN [Cupriavidus sp. EM10]